MEDAPLDHGSEKSLIIPADRLSDLLDIQLAQPGRTVRSSLYAVSLLVVIATTWAFLSVVNVTVRADGVIRPSGCLQGYVSPFTGIIDSIYVEENQFVRTGDTVLMFSSTDLDVEIQQNSDEQVRLRSEIEDVRMLTELQRGEWQCANPQYNAERGVMIRELRLMNVEISFATKKFVRTEKLHARGLASEEEFDMARSALESLQIKKERFTQERRSFYQAKRSSLLHHLAALEKDRLLLNERKAKRAVIANVRGHMLQLRVQKSHTPVSYGQELFVISPDSNLRAELFVAPKDIGAVKDGLRVLYRVEALPFQEWGGAAGRIQTVSGDVYVEKSGGQGYFKIIASIDEKELCSRHTGKSASLMKGMSLHGGIVVGEKRLLQSLWDRTVEYYAFR